jgi:hypothetical protein
MIGNWREWLGTLTSEKRGDLMRLLGVSSPTITTWKKTKTRPQLAHLYGLINFEPALKESIEQEYPDAFQAPALEETHLQISRQLYEDILLALAFTAESVSGQTIANRVFVSLCSLLDPNDEGLIILPSLCIEEEQAITRLMTTDGYGTGIWKSPHTALPYCELGRDSLMGMAITRRRHVLFPHTGFLDHRPFVTSPDKIASAAAFPLWRRGNIAGAFLVASVHPDFFNTNRCDVCAMHAHAYALSLPDDKFYNPARIALRMVREGVGMPETGDEADGEADGEADSSIKRQ